MKRSDQDQRMRRQVRAVISGKVQGVWYRGWTVSTATDLKLDGWVRNRRDGTVEAVFAGPSDVVQDMLNRLYDGPPAAQVSGVSVRPDETPLRPGFSQEPTL